MSEGNSDILKDIHISKIIWPVLIGVIIVFYMIIKQLDIDQIRKIDWNTHVYFWIGIAILIYVIRHLALSLRLRLMSNNTFSFKKSIELIFIWEFSSAVSPTSFGGTAVALFFLAQEKLKTSSTIALVLYSVVLDAMFFLISIPLLFFTVGPIILRPDLHEFSLADRNVVLIIIVYTITFLYTTFFFIGLFVHPENVRKFLNWLSGLKILKKFSEKLRQTGNNFILASRQMSEQGFWFHFRAIFYTIIAWGIRFSLINVLIIAFSNMDYMDLFNQLVIYGRSQNLYVLSALLPSPGSSGFSELLFNGFFKDYVPLGISVLVIILWRLISFYSYLLAGVIVVPNWINKILKNRHKEN
ncbi:MAG: lysylphosphatidylglycerol synthase transmembrane domain-containing protein [Saprospiraceae bacterium]